MSARPHPRALEARPPGRVRLAVREPRLASDTAWIDRLETRIAGVLRQAREARGLVWFPLRRVVVDADPAADAVRWRTAIQARSISEHALDDRGHVLVWGAGSLRDTFAVAWLTPDTAGALASGRPDAVAAFVSLLARVHDDLFTIRELGAVPTGDSLPALAVSARGAFFAAGAASDHLDADARARELERARATVFSAAPLPDRVDALARGLALSRDDLLPSVPSDLQATLRSALRGATGGRDPDRAALEAALSPLLRALPR